MYLTKTTDGGASWTLTSLISDVRMGHHRFPDINERRRTLVDAAIPGWSARTAAMA